MAEDETEEAAPEEATPEEAAPEEAAPEEAAPEKADAKKADANADEALADAELVGGSSAADGEDEEQHLLPKNLPDPYCQRPWREMVGGLMVVAALVAGVTIYNHRSGTSAVAIAAAPAVPGQMLPGQMLPGQVLPAGPLPVVAGVRPVAFTQPIAAAVPTVGAPEPRTAFNAAAHSARPSVVGIRALGVATAGQPGFERLGSGIIVSSAGYVLTCTHVIQGATHVAVSRFRHATERLPAQVVATDGDLTLLRVTGGTPLPAARFANPSALGVGDWVLALGHPFGMGLSVSAGIVGRRNAELTLPGGVRQGGLVQTDASINEGSSGGPLVNLNGEVVGLNMAILAPTGVFSGAGFAIDGGRALAFVQRHLGAASPAQLAANRG